MFKNSTKPYFYDNIFTYYWRFFTAFAVKLRDGNRI
jgi:hypothetical protein